MSKYKFWAVVRTVVLGGTVFAFGMLFCKFNFDQSKELGRARQIIEVAREDFRQVGLKFDALTEEVIALTTPKHREAIRLVTSWKVICSRITLAKMIETGDSFCASAMGQDFPSRKIILQVLTDPEMAIQVAKEIIIDRCTLVEGEKPQICIEFRGVLSQ
jgi:hypothetical protein